MSSRVKPLYWREAASLMLMAPNGSSGVASSKSDFDLLMLKRGGKSSFMANTYVFPGGVAGDGDFDSVGWTNKVFRNLFGFTDVATLRTVFHIPGSRPPMMVKNEDTNIILPPEIAFRICAIRETFEETGILIVSNQSTVDLTRSIDRRLGNVPDIHVMPTSFNAKQWREKVGTDESEFQNLCDEYKVVPNIWALYEWTNWLTPVFNKVTAPPKKPKRFDTMFFTCCLDKMPEETALYTEEIAHAEWKSPMEWYNLGKNGTITLVGPQFNETSRMTAFSSLAQLYAFFRQRESLGSIRWMSVNHICSDGVFLTLPADELYPESPDYEGREEISTFDETVKSVCLRAKRLNRGVRGSWTYFVNVEMPCGHPPHQFALKSFPEDFDINNPSSKL